MEKANGSGKVVPSHVLLPFILITVLFPLWGFANDVTNPMVKAFSRILQMSNFQGSLVQFAWWDWGSTPRERSSSSPAA
jgi:FHS family L-fucose permease-like MFS transporter